MQPPHNFDDLKQTLADRAEAGRLRDLLQFSDPETPPSEGPFGVAPEPKSTSSGHGKQSVPWSPADQKQLDAWKAHNMGADGKLKGDAAGQRPFRAQMLVRSFAGDLGARPATSSTFQSVDIWTVTQATPPVPVAVPTWSPSGLVYSNGYTTLYAHVWNLGLAPVIAARIEFWEAPHVAGAYPAAVKLIGVARADLANRHSTRCQTIVACPETYHPSAQFTAAGVSIVDIVVRVSAFADPAPPNVWDPTTTRHIARKVMKIEATP